MNIGYNGVMVGLSERNLPNGVSLDLGTNYLVILNQTINYTNNTTLKAQHMLIVPSSTCIYEYVESYIKEMMPAPLIANMEFSILWSNLPEPRLYRLKEFLVMRIGL